MALKVMGFNCPQVSYTCTCITYIINGTQSAKNEQTNKQTSRSSVYHS